MGLVRPCPWSVQQRRVVPGLVGAETFAAVDPRNNSKRSSDLAMLATREETHRYVFFLSPKFQGGVRQSKLERNGVQVWSVDISKRLNVL
jgi:hypothetical protein